VDVNWQAQRRKPKETTENLLRERKLFGSTRFIRRLSLLAAFRFISQKKRDTTIR
jgi:hypothetical protein